MGDMKLKRKIVKNLRRKGKKYRKTSKLHSFQSITAPKKMIDQRPEIINNRKRLGDLEGDTIILNGLERFYTLVDRKSGYLLLEYIPNGKAKTIHQKTLELSKRKE
jgi:IS30 family transposase